MIKVTLDALIPREDFEIKDEQNSHFNRNVTTISINDLKNESFFFSAIRKPDFQRETNEWDGNRIIGLIKSFIQGDLIPAIILWRNSSGYTFVIDGSHRLSALAAWVNDDYGDGQISKKFYDGVIPDEQIKIADDIRRKINKEIGAFSEYILAVSHPNKVKEEIQTRAKMLGTLALQIQWLEGNASKAEDSFFKINQQSAPIDDTEIKLLKTRKKPNSLAARAIIRSGRGHQYWSSFPDEKQKEIQSLALDVHKILFEPKVNLPIKTLDLPLAGKVYASTSLPLVLSFVNNVNGVVDADETDDSTGEKTVVFLRECLKMAQRFNSNHPSSLGLHPIIYFYSRDGRHKLASFLGTVSFVKDLVKRKKINNFIKVRSDFENIIFNNQDLVQQIVRKHRSAEASHEKIRDFYFFIIDILENGINKNNLKNEISTSKDFSYLNLNELKEDDSKTKDFSREKKSQIFIEEALKNAPVCSICNGVLHKASITIDHVVRKEDGGLGTLDNGKLAHPYCNSSYKN